MKLSLTEIRKVKTWLSVLFWFPLVVLTSCQPEESNVGLGIHPADDRIDLLETTLSDYAFHTRSIDSIQSNNLSQAVIGDFFDPVFGITEARLATHIRIPVISIDLGDVTQLRVDSVRLLLKVEDVYGDPSTGLDLDVFELDEDISIDSSYYSHQNFAVKPEPLDLAPDSMVIYDEDQAFVFEEDSLTGFISFPLSTTWGKTMLEYSGTEVFENNTQFIETFKGILIEEKRPGIAPNEGALYALNPFHAFTGITIFYTDTTDPQNPSSEELEFLINQNSARVGLFSHDHNAGTVGFAVNDTAQSHVEVYLQSLSGLKGQLIFPELENLLDSLQILNKAELILPIAPSTVDDLENIPKIILGNIIGDSLPNTLLPDQLEGDEHINGYYDEVCSCYKFTITRYVQQLANGKINSKGIELLPGSSGILARRSILVGKNHSLEGPQLKLTITNF